MFKREKYRIGKTNCTHRPSQYACWGWIKPNGLDEDYSDINSELKYGHQKLYDMDTQTSILPNNKFGGISCWAPSKNTLFVAWINVLAFNLWAAGT